MIKMNQIQKIEEKPLSLKHKIILIGFMILVTIIFLLGLKDEPTPYRAGLNWLGTIFCFIYLWLRPEAIALKIKGIQPKKIDRLMYLALALWVIALFTSF